MLDKFDEIEFANQLFLPRSKRVPSGLNFECPFCKEGKSQGRKRRGYLLLNHPQKGNRFYCHNCHIDLSFRNFLREYNPALYEEYNAKEKAQYIEKLKKGEVNAKQRKVNWNMETASLKYYIFDRRYFSPVASHQPAMEYLKYRKIPDRIIEKLFYVPGRKLDQYTTAETRAEQTAIKDMVIFPFYAPEGIYGYQGRSIQGKSFHTNSQPGHKIYNIFNVDLDKRVYIFESIIDSLFVRNSISMLGTSLPKTYLEKIRWPVFVYDNDVSYDTLHLIESCIDLGYEVVIWPDNIKDKDVNKMVMSGIKNVREIIDNNIFSGFEAKTKIKLLKLKKKRI